MTSPGRRPITSASNALDGRWSYSLFPIRRRGACLSLTTIEPWEILLILRFIHDSSQAHPEPDWISSDGQSGDSGSSRSSALSSSISGLHWAALPPSLKTGSVGSTALLPKQAEATLIPGPSSPSILAGCFKVGTVLGQQVIHDVFGPRGLGVFLTDTAAASGYVIQHAIAETLPDAPS